MPQIDTLFREVARDEAYELVGQLTNQTKSENDAMEVFSGQHPAHGSVHIVIPPIGNPILLPFIVSSDRLPEAPI